VTSETPPELPVFSFGIEISGACRQNCSFCYQAGRRSKSRMPFETFKGIVDGVARQNSTAPVFVLGGSTFSHPSAFKMIEYAVRTLGAGRVYVNAGIADFPDEKAESKAFIRKLCGARLVVSIDREHVRNVSKVAIRAKHLFTGLKEAGMLNHTMVISVALKKYELQHPIPPELVGTVPKALLNRLDNRFAITPFNPLFHRQERYWKRIASGVHRDLDVPPIVSPIVPVDLIFRPDGKLGLSHYPSTFDSPRLEIGHWDAIASPDFHRVLNAKIDDIARAMSILDAEDYHRWKAGRGQDLERNAEEFARTRVQAFQAEAWRFKKVLKLKERSRIDVASKTRTSAGRKMPK